MPPRPSTLLAYSDVREVLDRALTTDRGIRIKLDSHTTANNFKQRCNKLRVMDREQNMSIYEKDHQLYGVSVYDELTINNFENVLTIRKRSDAPLDIEEL